MANDFDRSILDRVAHRPWPMPGGPWVMTQTWHDLLFAHWPVAARDLRPLVPPAFELDTFAGDAWIGVVPFSMTNVAPRGVPTMSWISEFPELNVRTYVRVGDRPGVFFFSLDAASRLAVKTARRLLNLPYFFASMTSTSDRSRVTYESRREHSKQPATFRGDYWPIGPGIEAQRESLEYFLTERYCLYGVDRQGRPYRMEIHHPPWALQPADAVIRENTMADAAGISLPAVRPLLHFAKRQDTVVWSPTTGMASSASSSGSTPGRRRQRFRRNART
jgi:uncharacterized protein YqjF (DUF2071 family)